jgi:hypothetical protein
MPRGHSRSLSLNFRKGREPTLASATSPVMSLTSSAGCAKSASGVVLIWP